MGLKPHEKAADVSSLGSLLLELTVGARAPSEDPKSLTEGIYAHGFIISQLIITT